MPFLDFMNLALGVMKPRNQTAFIAIALWRGFIAGANSMIPLIGNLQVRAILKEVIPPIDSPVRKIGTFCKL